MERGRSEAGKAAHLWKEFDGTVAVADCGVCSTFTSQMKGGRPSKRKQATLTVRQNTSPDNSDVSASQADSEQEFLPQDASMPTKSPHSRILTDMQTSPISLKDHTMETCIQTSPLKTQAQGKPSLRPINELSSPLSKEEEAYMTQLIRIKLSESEYKTTVRCRTRGQPLVLKKLTMPRKPSLIAGSPLRKKRSKLIDKIKLNMSGRTIDDAVRQQGAELKRTTKHRRQKVLQSAGLKQLSLNRKQGLAWRT